MDGSVVGEESADEDAETACVGAAELAGFPAVDCGDSVD